MTRPQATAEAFWTAFEDLRPIEKQAVLKHMLRDRTLRRDLLDLAMIESRKTELARPLRSYLEGR